MIVGIGTDVVSIERIAGVLERHGDRFLDRILTPEERRRYDRTKSKASHLAKRWAAKEAFSKAIGTGIHPPFTWKSISVGRDAEGKPVVRELEKIRKAGEAIRGHGMRFNAGHALNYANVKPVAALPGIRELHIGHAIVSRAVFVGMREAVREMKSLMTQAAQRR